MEEKHTWTKKCPYCKKEFQTTSRNAKYCSDTCSKKYNKRRTTNKRKYSETKDVERLRARGHSIAVETIRILTELGHRTGVCEICGSVERLEVHHIDKFNWLNNTPDNLIVLCNKCHAVEHSKQEAILKEQGITLDDWYEKSMLPFYEVLNKNCN